MWSALLAITLAACGTDPTCVDTDGDGFGLGCALGDDCDDRNAARTLSCDAPPPDCDADPTLTGCACLPGTTACFDGLPEQQNVGTCTAGRAICVNGFWGVCVGSVPPGPEFCDGTDRDCDGEIDEGVSSPCGGCTPGCIGGVWGEGDAPFVEGETTTVSARGSLTLPHDLIESEQVWVANSGEDTVSRIDGALLRETGRFYAGSSPSRVAVDYRGNAWVASRAFDAVGELRQVAAELSDCVDLNDSGSIETSTGPEVVEGDECVLRTVPVGRLGDVPRALAIDGDLGLDASGGGDLWVGLHEGERIVHLDGVSLAVIEEIETPAFKPYAFAFDSLGTLWGISRDGYLLSLDRYDPARTPIIREVPLACFELYGLAVDEEGRVAMTGFGCDLVTVYDPRTDRYVSVSTPQSVRGAVAEGSELFVVHTEGLVSRLQTFPLALVDTYSVGSGLETIGVGLTARHVWAASSRGHVSGSGLAAALDRETGEVVAEVPVGFAPHTQGDLTGAKRRGLFREMGSARHLFEGCADGETVWRDLRVAARLGGGRIEVYLRRADSAAGLDAQPWTLVGEAIEGEVVLSTALPNAGVVEVEVRLYRGDVDAAPRLRRVGFEWTCPGPM